MPVEIRKNLREEFKKEHQKWREKNTEGILWKIQEGISRNDSKDVPERNSCVISEKCLERNF